MEFLDNFATELFAGLGTLLGAIVAYYIRKGILHIASKVDRDGKKELAKSVVRWVEQVYSDIDGREKFEIAKLRLYDLAEEDKIPITRKQAETFIEEAVREFKDSFGEDWAPRGDDEDEQK